LKLNSRLKKVFLFFSVIGFLLIIMIIWDTSQIGLERDSYRGVAVYENGFLFFRGHGKNHAADGYYYGQKWQCVEYIKRFYKVALNHKMPFAWGHARDYFDTELADGSLNKKRGLVQFKNGSTVAPKVDDILVFQDSQYGHVGIISEVTGNTVVIVQQNIFGKPRQTFQLSKKESGYFIATPRLAAGWLRKQLVNNE